MPSGPGRDGTGSGLGLKSRDGRDWDFDKMFGTGSGLLKIRKIPKTYLVFKIYFTKTVFKLENLNTIPIFDENDNRNGIGMEYGFNSMAMEWDCKIF